MLARQNAHRQIATGFSLFFGALLLAKSVGAAKEVVIANAYGANSAIDAFAVAYTLSQMPVTLTAMVANVVLIPLFVAMRHGDGNASAQARLIIGRTLWASLPIALCAYLLMAHIIP